MSVTSDDDEAAHVQQWAERLGVDRSELLRRALHRFLVNDAAGASMLRPLVIRAGLRW